MKILAIQKEVPGVDPRDITEVLLRDEAIAAYNLYLEGIFREIYFRYDKDSAIIILENDSIEEARKSLYRLPLVKENLIDFDLIPLRAYPGFKRLFKE